MADAAMQPTAPAEERALLEVDALEVRAHGPQGARTILSDVSLQVRAAETVGVVGESGSGKSTLCRAISLTLPEGLQVTSGRVRLRGMDLLGRRAAAVHGIRRGGIRMVFQHPKSTLNPVMPIGKQITEAIHVVREVSRTQARREGAELLAEMGIEDAAARMGDYAHEFSGGQRQRIVIAIALAGEPALLLADEPTSSLDVTTQASILKMLARIARERNTGIVLVSHNYAVVSELCERTVVLYAGRTAEEGPTRRVLSSPAHPYTAGLIDCLPSVDTRSMPLPVIPGEPPHGAPGLAGCPFVPRCRHSVEECATTWPELRPIGSEHRTACSRFEQIDELNQGRAEGPARILAARDSVRT